MVAPAVIPHRAGSTSPEELTFEFDLRLDSGSAHAVDFGLPHVDPLIVDEPEPVGAGRGPNPSRLLAAAVASCLASSLLFCLRKSRIDVTGLHSRVRAQLARNERGRLRVAEIRVVLSPSVSDADRARMTRCLDIFEDFCVVTQSVKSGVQVSVAVEPESPTSV